MKSFPTVLIILAVTLIPSLIQPGPLKGIVYLLRGIVVLCAMGAILLDTRPR